jgi:hypothetical protein
MYFTAMVEDTGSVAERYAITNRLSASAIPHPLLPAWFQDLASRLPSHSHVLLLTGDWDKTAAKLKQNQQL